MVSGARPQNVAKRAIYIALMGRYTELNGVSVTRPLLRPPSFSHVKSHDFRAQQRPLFRLFLSFQKRPFFVGFQRFSMFFRPSYVVQYRTAHRVPGMVQDHRIMCRISFLRSQERTRDDAENFEKSIATESREAVENSNRNACSAVFHHRHSNPARILACVPVSPSSRDGTRTRMGLPPGDFKSPASAIPPPGQQSENVCRAPEISGNRNPGTDPSPYPNWTAGRNRHHAVGALP